MFKLLKKMIHPVFFHLCLWCLAGVFGDNAVKSVSGMGGNSVTLKPDNTEIQREEVIEWRFGHNNILIARINRQNNKSTFYDASAGGRFRGRLKLDQTGSLIITNTRTTDSGFYKVTSRTDTSLNKFNLIVYAPLSIPIITRCPSSSSLSNYSLLCSVVNVSHVTLSWYIENSLFTSISLSLPLEVEYQDKNTYDPISKSSECCGLTESAIRLVHAALAGVVTVVVLVYEFRCRSLRQKRREQTSASHPVSDYSDTHEDGDVREQLQPIYHKKTFK